MTVKSKNIIILILNLAIVILEFGAFFKVFQEGAGGNMQVQSLRENLMFFTNLSNIFMGIVCLASIPYILRNLKSNSTGYPHWFFILKYVVMVMMTVTFITCVVFLGPITGIGFVSRGGLFIDGYLFLFSGIVFFLHFFCPLLSMILVLFFERTDNFVKKEVWYALIPVVLYAILYTIMVVVIGEDNGGWPDFYGFTFGGHYEIAPLTALVMFASSYLIAYIEWKIINKKNKKIAG